MEQVEHGDWLLDAFRQTAEQIAEHNTRHAIEAAEYNTRYEVISSCFGGRLTYRRHDDVCLELALDPNFDDTPTPELSDLNAIEHSACTLHNAFEDLERAGVSIPDVYVLSGEAEPEKNWRDLLQQINQNVSYLHSIVVELLSEKPRPTVTVDPV